MVRLNDIADDGRPDVRRGQTLTTNGICVGPAFRQQPDSRASLSHKRRCAGTDAATASHRRPWIATSWPCGMPWISLPVVRGQDGKEPSRRSKQAHRFIRAPRLAVTVTSRMAGNRALAGVALGVAGHAPTLDLVCRLKG